MFLEFGGPCTQGLLDFFQFCQGSYATEERAHLDILSRGPRVPSYATESGVEESGNGVEECSGGEWSEEEWKRVEVESGIKKSGVEKSGVEESGNGVERGV